MCHCGLLWVAMGCYGLLSYVDNVFRRYYVEVATFGRRAKRHKAISRVAFRGDEVIGRTDRRKDEQTNKVPSINQRNLEEFLIEQRLHIR